jgi:hypothetical protein
MCLQEIENKYQGKIGFIGEGSRPDIEDPLSYKSGYWLEYGNLTELMDRT